MIPVWFNDPTILLNSTYILQLWPTKDMTFEAKVNAISRLVILMTSVGYLVTGRWSLVVVGCITLAIMFTLYRLRKRQIVKEGFKDTSDANSNSNNKVNKESITNLSTAKTITNPVTLETLLQSDFHPTDKRNPFGNVLLTDIADNPDRKAAAPSFNPDVYDDINKAVKKQTQMLNPDIINTNKQLYGDLKDNYDLDKSMMRFYSTANTRVTNDQGAFSEYLYGSMPSSKSSGPDGAYQRVADAYRYILI